MPAANFHVFVVYIIWFSKLWASEANSMSMCSNEINTTGGPGPTGRDVDMSSVFCRDPTVFESMLYDHYLG